MGNVIFSNVKLNQTKKNIGLDIRDMSLPLDNIIGVVGAKTSGKSNFLDVLSGKIHPQSGTITFDDGELNKGDLFYVSSQTYEPSFSTIKDLMDKIEKDYPNFSRDVAIKYFTAMEIPTEKIMYRNFDRRVQSAINCILAIASRARITILDQPCRNMHMKLREMLYGFAKEDYEEFKRTILISSNIALDIDKIATHVVYLRQGKLVFSLPYEEVDSFAVGLLGRNEVIKEYASRAEVFYSANAENNLVHKVVRNTLPLDAMKSLQLNGVITQYVNLVNFHTYVVKEDFGFEEEARIREEEERIKAEKKAAKRSKKQPKNVTLVAKTDDVTSSKPVKQEEKESFGEKLKRILTTPL